MKRIIAILASAVLLTNALPLRTSAENIGLYEAENAVLFGTITTIDNENASGGLVVGNLSDSSDKIDFSITVPTDGIYDLTFCSMGIGGDKTNNIHIDGNFIGDLKSTGDTLSEYTLHSIALTKGEHTVSITSSWGWIQVDYLEISTADSIPESVYEVDNTLINPNATDNAKSLFNYLCSSYGKTTLAGQVCNDGLKGEEFQAIYEETGKYPALLGLDMMNYSTSRTAHGAESNAVETAIDFHNAGGIITFCWHWNAPEKYILPDTEGENPNWWGAFYTDKTNLDLAAVMNGDDPEGLALLDADIAVIAEQMHRLEDAGVPVLWRPLHESGGGWFWWSAAGNDAYKKFWVYLYEQLTNVHRCNNLIWIWNGDSADWYPGDEYVDIIGLDIYTNPQQYTANASKFSDILKIPAENKIIAMTENGVIFDVDDMLATNAKWSWFGTWVGEYVVKDGVYNETYTEKEILKKAYDSEYVITLDELPKLYESTAVKGDVNADGVFSVADVVLLQKWLLAVPDVTLADWKAGDLCEDNALNVFDLCLMKRLLVAESS